MKSDIAQKWVDALRGNRYRQGRNALKQQKNGEIKHCCLGVLCELYQLEASSPLDERELGPCGFTFMDGSSDFLPRPVMHWAGMGSNNGDFHDPVSDRGTNLVDLNDKGMDFSKLADIIEIHKEEL